MQPSSVSTEASTRASGFRRCLRPRGVMGGASLVSLEGSVIVEVNSRCLVSGVGLRRIDDHGVVEPDRGHVQLVADGQGLSIRGACTACANPGGGALGADIRTEV